MVLPNMLATQRRWFMLLVHRPKRRNVSAPDYDANEILPRLETATSAEIEHAVLPVIRAAARKYAAQFRLPAADVDDVVHDSWCAIAATNELCNPAHWRSRMKPTTWVWSVVRNVAQWRRWTMTARAAGNGLYLEHYCDPTQPGDADRAGRLLDALDARSRLAVVLRFGLDWHHRHTWAMVGTYIGVGKRQAQKIVAKALRTMEDFDKVQRETTVTIAP